ncbi:MAG: M23 family metallopeptidase [Oscillospiraceae bacterium]|nr:M23 family metallopeptidase [Oscillospiraceae bacterium]
MKRDRAAGALLALCALAAAKLVFPEAPALLREKAQQVLGKTADYRAAFSALEDYLSPRSDGAALPEAAANPGRETVAVSYVLEEGTNQGEYPVPEAAELLPEAVTAFLERQSAYSSYSFPDNVDISMPELPFSYAAPVAGLRSSGFGFRTHPILNEIKFHFGTDFAAFSGDDVLAFAAGTVRFAGVSDSYGNYVILDHGEGWSSLYAHCSYLYVQTGQTVAQGDKIALVGATGHVTGPHLHFELRRDGVYFNPEYYVNG